MGLHGLLQEYLYLYLLYTHVSICAYLLILYCVFSKQAVISKQAVLAKILFYICVYKGSLKEGHGDVSNFWRSWSVQRGSRKVSCTVNKTDGFLCIFYWLCCPLLADTIATDIRLHIFWNDFSLYLVIQWEFIFCEVALSRKCRADLPSSYMGPWRFTVALCRKLNVYSISWKLSQIELQILIISIFYIM
jgi:hypothetical protein